MFDRSIEVLMQLLSLIPFKRLSSLLIKNEFNAVWCSGTLLYFLFFLALLVRRTWPIRAALRRVTAPLRGMGGLESFARQFEAYQRSVQSEARLQHAWQEFSESLITPREGESLRIRNTQEPSLFFNDGTVVQPSVHNRFLDTVPNHLVGFGILGTFLGLAAGVGLAAGKLDSANPEDVRLALRNLLNGASLAFMTSIVGLGCSILFLFAERVLVGSVHRQLDRWVTALEANVELVTPEKIALEQLDQATRQTKQLERFNTELVFSIEKALDERVAGRLAPAFEKLIQAVEALRSERADSNTSAMQRLVDEFARHLSSSTNREMQQITSAMEALGDRLQVLIAAAEESHEQGRSMLDDGARRMLDALSSGAGSMSANFSTAADGISSAMRSASEDLAARVSSAGAQMSGAGEAAAAKIAASLGTFSESVARLERASTAQDALATHLQDLSTGLRSAGETVLEAHRGFKESLEPSRSIARSLETAGNRLSESLDHTARLVAESQAIGTAIQAEHEKIAAVWREYEERFRGVDQALRQAFQELEVGVGRYTEQIRAFHSEADQHMGKNVELLASATGELLQAVEELGERLPGDRR